MTVPAPTAGDASPVGDSEVNALLGELLAGVRAVLGPEFVGMYLSGSLVAGEFDRASDVDVVVVTETEVSGERLASLDALHTHVAQRDAWCATELECTYISRAALRRFDPARAVHPTSTAAQANGSSSRPTTRGGWSIATFFAQRASPSRGPIQPR